MNKERLIKLVNDLTFDYDRLSTSGKETLDDIISLLNAPDAIRLKRVFVNDAIDEDENICSGVVYLYPDEEWKSGDMLMSHWHIEIESSGACGQHYFLMLERSEYRTEDDSIPELERLEAMLFEWISDENDECKVELVQ